MTNRRTAGAALIAAAGLVLSSLTLVAPAQAAPGDATISATPNAGLGEFTVVSVSGNAGPKSTDNNGSDPGGVADANYPNLYISMCVPPLTASSCDTDPTNFGEPVTLNPDTSPRILQVVVNQTTGAWGPVNFLVRRTLVNGDGQYDCSKVQCVIGSANAPRPKDHSYDATQNLAFTPVLSAPTRTSGPTVTGTAAVGRQLACAVSYQNADSRTFRWLRNGAAIAGATGQRYTTTASDYQRGIACASAASNAIGSSGEKTSAARTIAKGAALKSTSKPTVSGKAKVGKKLKATTGKWSPKATSYTYRWLRNGKAIKGTKATKATYKLTKKDAKKKVSVRVTAASPGYAPGTATSAKTKKVK